MLGTGFGYFLWLALGRPRPTRALTWLWCGLAGFCGQALFLQALIYLDLPLNLTAPWSLGVAALGSVALIVDLVRRGRTRWRSRGKEVGMILGAGLAAGLVQATALVGIGSDRFIGTGQIDQLHYVMTTQFLVERPFSTEWADMGLHPWLYRPVDLKRNRITECVVLGETAIVSRTDSQRAWGATVVFFAGLLGVALAGAARVGLRMPLTWAACTGVVAAGLPAITTIQQSGFFSQLTVLFVFPALLAVCRPGALRPWPACVLAALLLGFLAGAYSEFFPLGAALAVLLLLAWPGWWVARLLRATLVVGAALVLVTQYLQFFFSFLLVQAQLALRREGLDGFAPDGGTWRGWGGYFSAGPPAWVIACGVVVVAAGLGALGLLPRRSRLWWLLASLPALLLGVVFTLQAKLPVYALHKLCIQFVPLVAVLAAAGFWLGARRLRLKGRRLTTAVALVAGSIPLVSSIRQNLALAKDYGTPTASLWAARARAEAANPGQVYLIGGYNGLIGGWLAYFARHSSAYYEQPILTDRRVPTEAQAFRRIPASRDLQWLDPVRTGPVTGYEPSPLLEITSPCERLTLNYQPAYRVGRETHLVLHRTGGFSPVEREFVLEAGLMPVTGGATMTLELAGPAGWRKVYQLAGPMLLLERLTLTAGDNHFVLRVTSAAPEVLPARPLLLLQSLGVEQIPNPKL